MHELLKRLSHHPTNKCGDDKSSFSLLLLIASQYIAEAPMLDEDSINNLEGNGISMRLRSNFDQVETNNAMKHVPSL